MEEITDESYIGLICNGEFNAIPDFKIGELFESFFDNINYNVVKEESNIYVDFTGEAICDDEPCIILIRFKVDANAEEFEIDKVKVDDDILNEDEVLDLLEDIAYVGGAILEEDYCSDCGEESCSHCPHKFEENDYEDDCEDEDEDDEENENKKHLDEENDDNE